jgi:hypothetical protein
LSPGIPGTVMSRMYWSRALEAEFVPTSLMVRLMPDCGRVTGCPGCWALVSSGPAGARLPTAWARSVRMPGANEGTIELVGSMQAPRVS